MISPVLSEAALELIDAAADVVATAEGGDLDQALAWLEEALAGFNAAHPHGSPDGNQKRSGPTGCHETALGNLLGAIARARGEGEIIPRWLSAAEDEAINLGGAACASGPAAPELRSPTT